MQQHPSADSPILHTSASKAAASATVEPWWRRIRRRTDTGLSAISLLAFFAVAIGWAGSYRRTSLLEGSFGKGQSFVLAQSAGEVLLGTPLSHPNSSSSVYLSPTIAPKDYGLESIVWLFVLGDRSSRDWGWKGFGVVIQTDALDGARPARMFFAPHWGLLVATAVLPSSWAFAWWRRRRRLPGFCLSCGYDLRATPSGCPECGAVS